MTTLGPPTLYIGHARDMTVVSTRPLKVEHGAARVTQWGRVADVVPGPAGQSVRLSPGRKMLILTAVLFGGSAVAAAAGAGPWAFPPALAAVATLIYSGHVEARRGRPGRIVPPESGGWVLAGRDERNAMWNAGRVARRICRTLPSLAGMVDTDHAERLVASALADLAGVLAKRQEVRGLLRELDQRGRHGLPARSPAARKLADQRERLERAVADIDADVRRRFAGLRATDAAGLNFLRERDIHQVTARVDRTLAGLALPGTPGAPDAGLELADEVHAVLAVYRELNERYGADG